MERIVVAIANDDVRKSVTEIIQKSGMRVRASVRSGSETVKAVRSMDGGVVICSPRLKDMSSDVLCGRLEDEAYYLVVGHPADLSQILSGEVFKLTLPVKASELIGSVRILTQLDERRITEKLKPVKRSVEDNEVIAEAKEYLIDHRGMSEAEAHRFLQKTSMDTGTPVTEVAKTILFHV